MLRGVIWLVIICLFGVGRSIYEGADRLAGDDLGKVARGVHVEYDYGLVVFFAKGGGGEVHHAQAAVVNLVVGDFGEFGGGGVFLRVGGIYAIYASAFEHDISFDLDGAESRAGVGGEEGVAGAAGNDCHSAFFDGIDGVPLAVVFSDGEHIDCGEHLGGLAYVAQRRRQRERVDDGGKHTHLVAFDAVKAFGGACHAAEDVAATDDDSYLYSVIYDFFYLVSIRGEALCVDAVALVAHQRFAAELEQYAIIFCAHGICDELGLVMYVFLTKLAI